MGVLRYVCTLLTFGKAFVLCRGLRVLTLRRWTFFTDGCSSLLRVYFVNLRQSLRPMPWVKGAHVAEMDVLHRYVCTLLTFGKAFVLCRGLTVLTSRRGD